MKTKMYPGCEGSCFQLEVHARAQNFSAQFLRALKPIRIQLWKKNRLISRKISGKLKKKTLMKVWLFESLFSCVLQRLNESKNGGKDEKFLSICSNCQFKFDFEIFTKFVVFSVKILFFTQINFTWKKNFSKCIINFKNGHSSKTFKIDA